MIALPVGDGHTLHVEEHGNPDGLPAVFLHGGPGSGCQPDQVTLFDPDRFRIVMFDQRGAGRSTPKRGLYANTTRHLVADMEAIRTHLGIERWVVVGGSWGATLAVAYTAAHPSRVTGAILRGVFLGTRAEGRWAFERAGQIFRPELWRRFADLLPEHERGDPLESYIARLLDPDPAVHRPAAWAFHNYERALSVLTPSAVPPLPPALDLAALPAGEPPNSPFVEAHYLRHDCFLEPGELLAKARGLRAIPCIIVQGRYDLICPPETAHALAAAWAGAELRFVEGAGHSATEPAIRAGLVAAIADIAKRLRTG